MLNHLKFDSAYPPTVNQVYLYIRLTLKRSLINIKRRDFLKVLQHLKAAFEPLVLYLLAAGSMAKRDCPDLGIPNTTPTSIRDFWY
jgi:hypothetical protein